MGRQRTPRAHAAPQARADNALAASFATALVAQGRGLARVPLDARWAGTRAELTSRDTQRRYARRVPAATLSVVPYDPTWPERFATERALLERILEPWLEGGIHHIGSTAVPGLAAKPIVDMMAGVRDLEAARAAYAPLLEASYHSTRTGPASHTTSRSRRPSSKPRRTAST